MTQAGARRRLLVGAVALVPGRLPGSREAATAARDEVEALLDPVFFDKAPFKRVSVIIRYGTKTDARPELQPIEEDELPTATEVSMKELRPLRGDQLRDKFRKALLGTLIEVATRYGLPSDRLREALDRGIA